MSTQYVVMNEHTLGYIQGESPNMMGVLHGSVLKGGHDWKNGPVSTFGTSLRPATLADFEENRVLPPSDFLKTLSGFSD